MYESLVLITEYLLRGWTTCTAWTWSPTQSSSLPPSGLAEGNQMFSRVLLKNYLYSVSSWGVAEKYNIYMYIFIKVVIRLDQLICSNGNASFSLSFKLSICYLVISKWKLKKLPVLYNTTLKFVSTLALNWFIQSERLLPDDEDPRDDEGQVRRQEGRWRDLALHAPGAVPALLILIWIRIGEKRSDSASGPDLNFFQCFWSDSF